MTLSQYIIDNAKHIDSADFLSSFLNVDIFFSITMSSVELAGGPLITSPDIKIEIKTVQSSAGPVALFYTSASDDRLSHKFGGMPLIKAVEMTLTLPGVYGMLIQSEGDAWVVAGQESLKNVIGRL
jgi:hypothetical protein